LIRETRWRYRNGSCVIRFVRPVQLERGETLTVEMN
jgi:hypothetical protein